jgi:Protein of unknown function (DUF3800)
MDIFFADDSVQRAPTRQRAGRLVGVGGIHIPSEHVNPLERSLNQLCVNAGFPPGEEFKWSPSREDWMYQGLTGAPRATFFSEVLRLCSERSVRALVVVSDTDSKHPLNCASHEDFTILLLIERIEWLASKANRDVVVVFDRPGGARADEENFLAACLDKIQSGSPFVRPARIALNALSTSSHFVRLLQAADFLTGCVTAYVAGEQRFSPQLMPAIQPLLANSARVGGIGIKIHPDFWYANLYHWLFGDTHFWRGNVGHPYPLLTHPFARNASDWR